MLSSIDRVDYSNDTATGLSKGPLTQEKKVVEESVVIRLLILVEVDLTLVDHHHGIFYRQ